MIDGEYFTFFRAIRTNENGVVSKRKASRRKKRVVKKFDINLCAILKFLLELCL